MGRGAIESRSSRYISSWPRSSVARLSVSGLSAMWIPFVLSVAPIVAGHDALHEGVEKRHGEGRIAVARAPDHALGDQLVAGRRERGDLSPEPIGDVAGAVRPRA